MAKILKGDDFKKRLNLEERLEDSALDETGPLPGPGVVLDRELLVASEQARKVLVEAREDAAKIRSEARELLAQVKGEMERSKKEGYEQGHQEGLAQGLELLYRVKELRAKLFDDNEKEMIHLIFAIAEKIIGRELGENDKAILNVIRLAISDAVGDRIYVKLNPEDYENVKKNEAELLQRVEAGKTLVLREDETVKRGGCLIETEIGTIDAQLETQMTAIKKALEL